MKNVYFSVFDKAVGAYLPPFAVRSKGEAIRSFTDAVNDPKHHFSVHRGDFVLYAVGEFDDNSGLFTGYEPVRVISGEECVRLTDGTV